jgi:hypothetical protein
MTQTAAMPFARDDGGRAAAGYRGTADDCVCRAAAIVTGRPYQEIYDLINELGRAERPGKRQRSRSSARTGVYKDTTRKLMAELGLEWTPTMGIGTGCRVHLTPGELPSGRLITSVTKHITAVIDGVVHDLYDPSRDGTRCVYGYWSAR